MSTEGGRSFPRACRLPLHHFQETGFMTSRFTRFAAASALTFGLGALVSAETGKDEKKPAGEKHEHGQAAAGAAGTAKLDASLVEPEKKAKEQAATVKVTVSGVKIVDPATEGDKPVAG